jgi:hypothetical protein
MANLRTTLLPYESLVSVAHHARLDQDMEVNWLHSLPACRRSLRAAKAFAIINATLEKWSLAVGYLGLSWASIILLSGHAANLDLLDFWVVTILLVVAAARAVIVVSTSKLTKLWQAGCLNSKEGHILPLTGEGNASRRYLGTCKCVVMLTSCILAVMAMGQLGHHASYAHKAAQTLVPALYIFYSCIVLEAVILLAAVCHRAYRITYKKRHYLRLAAARAGTAAAAAAGEASSGHMVEQALLWRLFARHVLDACITGSILDGMQCHYIAFLVREKVFHYCRSSDGTFENVRPAVATRRAAALVDAFAAGGSALERNTLTWLLQHDPETAFWSKVQWQTPAAADSRGGSPCV